MLSSQFPTAYDAHDYELGQTHWVCKRCGNAVKQTHHGGTCIGVPIYEKWEEVPDTMATVTGLGKAKKKLAKDQLPVGAKKKIDHKGRFGGHYYPLYAIADADDKAEPTEAQIKALEKARYMAEQVLLPCVRCGWSAVGWVSRKKAIELSQEPIVCNDCQRRESIAKLCQQWIDRDDVVILDTETTGLYGADAIQISIIDTAGDVLLDTLVQTPKQIEPEAQYIHGISKDDLNDAPTADELHDQLANILKDKLVLIYNASFDQPIIQRQFGIKLKTDCVMLTYASYIGEWSDYHDDYRWQRLPGGDHSALGDCRATLAIIREMAEWKPEFKRLAFIDTYDLIEKHLQDVR